MVRIIGAEQDITERKQMEAALKASEAKYRTIFAASPDFLYLTDSAGKLLDANPALLEWQGSLSCCTISVYFTQVGS